MSETRIGLIGLGLLGAAIAHRLCSARAGVHGFDIDEGRRGDFVSLGGVWLNDPTTIADRCGVVILCLPTSDIVQAVCHQMQARLRPGCLVLDATTGDPSSTLAVAEKLRSAGVLYLDSTVVGSSEQVRGGEATILFGASAEAAALASPILYSIAPQVFHVGEVGSAAKMKLVVNLAIGLHRAVLAEALTLAKSLGLSQAAALRVMKASAAYSRMMDTKGEKMLSGDFTPQAKVAQHLKDVRLMLAAASQAGIALPLSTVNQMLLSKLVEAGLGDLDNSAVIKAYENGPFDT